MTKHYLSLLVTVLLLGALLALASLAQRVGGVSIRLSGTEVTTSRLQLPELVIRGVPTVVNLSELAHSAVTVGEVVWETEAGSTKLQRVRLPAATMAVSFPCAGPDSGRLLIRQVSDQKVLGAAPVQLLPPKEDCALK